MTDEPRHRLTRGWLRVLLGWTQMLLAAAAIGSLAVSDHAWLTWSLFAATVVAVIISRILYRGRDDANVEMRKE